MKLDFERSMNFYEKELANLEYNYRAKVNEIKMVIQFAKEMIEREQILSADDLKEWMYECMQIMVYYYTENVDCFGLITQQRIHKMVLNDKKFLYEEYNRIKDEELKVENANINYDEDEEYVKKDYIKTMLAYFRKEMSLVDSKMIDIVKKYGKFSKELGEKANLLMSMVKGNEYEQLQGYMRYNNILVEQQLKDKYVGLMIQIGDFFKGFKVLEKYREINDIELRRIGIESLSYPLKSNDEKDIGIEDIFEEKFLDGLDLEELAVLNTFWQNRFAKETKSVNEAIFYINTLDLWKDIIDGNPINIDNEQVLDAVFLKNRLMEEMAKIVIEGADETDKITIDKSRKACIFENMLKKLQDSIGVQYEEYFNNILPSSKNDFSDDLRNSIVLHSNKENIYFCKDSTITSLLNTFMNSKNIRNWGYMSEMSKSGQKLAKPITDKKYVLIGIDYEGYNMPLRFHMKRQRLEDELMRISGNTIMPIYEGEEDFWYKRELVTTQVFMPLDKKHKESIKELSKKFGESDSRYKIIKHLDFIRKAENFPEHLKEEEIEGRKRVKKRRRKYIDIKTGNIYEINGNKYVLENEGNGAYGEDGVR